MAAVRWLEQDDETVMPGPTVVITARAAGMPTPSTGRARPRSAPPVVVPRRPRTYLWRRLAAVLVVACLGAVVWSAAERLVAQASLKPGAVLGCPVHQSLVPGGAGSCGAAYVARPGDTIWSIAVRSDHGGDPRPIEDQLEAQIGGGVLQPGERLVLP
jgi:hypothetical protein